MVIVSLLYTNSAYRRFPRKALLSVLVGDGEGGVGKPLILPLIYYQPHPVAFSYLPVP